MNKVRSYFTTIGITVVILPGLLGGFNWLIDPYGLYRVVDLSGINRYKPAVYVNTSWAKSQALVKLRPRGIVLGTSRAEVGIDPDHNGWSADSWPRYNMALASGDMIDTVKYFKYANSVEPLKQVLLGLDYMMFRTKNVPAEFKKPIDLPPVETVSAWYENLPYRMASLFSLSATVASFNTLLSQKGSDGKRYIYNGMRSTLRLDHRQKKVGHRVLFTGSEKRFIYRRLYRASGPNGESRQAQFYPQALVALRDLIRLCADSGIDLRMYISPVHARQLEIIRAEEVWQDFEQWKRDLVSLLEEENKLNPRVNTTLWDFAFYNEVTTEMVPPARSVSKMRWFWESSHFSSELGDLIQDRVFNISAEDNKLLSTIAVMLKPDTLERHLASIRSQQQFYIDRHGDEVEEIRQLFERPMRRQRHRSKRL